MNKSKTVLMTVDARLVYAFIGLCVCCLICAFIIKTRLSQDQPALTKTELYLLHGDDVNRHAKDWELIAVPAAIREGDYLKTGRERDVVIACKDGSSLRFDRNTFVKFNTITVNDKGVVAVSLALHSGAFFADTTKKCVVSADLGSAQAEITASRAEIVARDRQNEASGDIHFAIAAVEGKVQVIHVSNPDKTIIVTPDQRLEVTKQELIHLPMQNADKWLKWNMSWQDVRNIPKFGQLQNTAEELSDRDDNSVPNEDESEEIGESGENGTELDKSGPKNGADDKPEPEDGSEPDSSATDNRPDVQQAQGTSAAASPHSNSHPASQAEQQALREAAARQQEFNRKRQAQQQRLDEEKAKEADSQNDSKQHGKISAPGSSKAKNASAVRSSEVSPAKQNAKNVRDRAAAKDNSAHSQPGAAGKGESQEPMADSDRAVPNASAGTGGGEQNVSHEPSAVNQREQLPPHIIYKTRRRAAPTGLATTPNPLDAKVGGMQDMEAKIGDSSNLDAKIGDQSNLDFKQADEWP
ncbi:MAG: hypothetical protein Q4F00_11265 [bacterium]|nr:hypothetical protein [bacterium]